LRVVTLGSLVVLGLSGCSQVPWPALGDDEHPPRARVLEGTFRYMADAALFEACDGARLPVVTRGHFESLEREYAGRIVSAGQPLGITITGELVPYDGEGPYTHALLPEAFEFWPAGADCSN
jgi:hypothetical protein